MPSDKDVVIEARELLTRPTTSVHFRDAAEPILNALADEVERLREDNESLREICEQKDAI